jgi:hypothetical protein
MKKLLGILVLSLLLSGNANSWTALGIFQCGELLSRQKENIIKKQVTAYVYGFISGVNYKTNGDVGEGTNDDAIFWSVVKYCKDNPLKDGVDASIHIYNQLKQ